MPLDFGARGNLIRVISGPQGEPGQDGNAVSNNNTYSSTWDGSTACPSQNAVYDKIESVIAGVGSRTGSTSNINYYVSTAGSDSNNGLTTGSTGAFATIQKAINVAANDRDPRGNVISILVDPGTYDAITLYPCVGTPNGGSPTITGSTTDPTLVVIKGSASNAISAYGMGNDWLVRGLTVNSTGGSGISADSNAWVRVSDVRFTGGSVAHIAANYGGVVFVQGGTITVAGDATYALYANHFASILVAGATVATTGARSFSEFARAQEGSVISMPSAAISTAGGSYTCRRFVAEDNSLFTDVSNNLTFFPGNSAGYVRGGSAYDDLLSNSVVAKTTNESRSSTAIAVDDQLVYSMSSAATYSVDGKIFYNSPSSADFVFSFSAPSSSAYIDLRFRALVPGSSTPAYLNENAGSFGPRTLANATTAAGTGCIDFSGIVQSSGSTGAFQLLWSPSTTIAVQVKAGSYFNVKRIA